MLDPVFVRSWFSKLCATLGVLGIALVLAPEEPRRSNGNFCGNPALAELRHELPKALVVVMDGWEQWVGNDEVIGRDDPTWTTTNNLQDTMIALSELGLTPWPAGSRGSLVTYGDRATLRASGPLGAFSPASFGSQGEYFGSTGSELVAGIELALRELRDVSAIKVILVIGDGVDTRIDHGERFRALRARAIQNRVEIRTIIRKTRISHDHDIGELDPSFVTVDEFGLRDAIRTAIDELR